MKPSPADTLARRTAIRLNLGVAAVVCVLVIGVANGWSLLVTVGWTAGAFVGLAMWILRSLSTALAEDRVHNLAPLALLNEELSRIAASESFGQLPYASEREDIQLFLDSINTVLGSADALKLGVEEMLDQMHQGVMSFEKDMTILKNHSRYILKIFGEQSPTGLSAVEYLFSKTDVPQDTVRQMQFHLRSLFGMNKLQWLVSSMNFVTQATVTVNRRKTDVRFHFFPTYDDKGNIVRISVVVEDITQFNQAKKQADHRQKEMEKMFSLLQVSDALFQTFMDETSQLFERLKAEAKILRDCDQSNYSLPIGRMFRYVHTLKGNSRLFKLNSIQDVAHDVETYLSDLRDGKVPFNQDALETLMSKLMEINQELYSYTSLRREILGRGERANNLAISYRVQWIKSLLSQFSTALRDPRIDAREIDRIQWELHRVLSSFEKTSLTEYIARYDAMIQELAGKFAKKVAPIVRKLDYRYFDSHTMGRLNDILGHLIRNSVDHGIETTEERDNRGKPIEGTIRIDTFGRDGRIQVVLSDDGAGLDRDRIVKKALERALISTADVAKLSDAEIYDFIFQAGFSTARAVTEVSGRGVGMDAVKAIAQEMGGEVSVSTRPGQGTSFTISFPEKHEGFMTSCAVFDISAAVQNSFKEFGIFFNLAKVATRFEDRLGGHHYFMMGDRLAIGEILKNICLELFDTVSPGSVVNCHLEAIRGSRKVDSFEFFRFVFKCEPGPRGVLRPINSESVGLKRVLEMIRKINGSIKVIGRDAVEVNVPSNMPVRFSEYAFRFGLFVENTEMVSGLVEEYFAKIMGGWAHEIFAGSDLKALNGAEPKDMTVIIVSEAQLEEYEKARDAKSRVNDCIVVISGSKEGLDKSDALAVLPDTVMFISGPVQRGNLANILEAIIVQRFAREIIDADAGESLPIALAG